MAAPHETSHYNTTHARGDGDEQEAREESEQEGVQDDVIVQERIVEVITLEHH
jgi:hypothetical protein